ncbi:MAG: hypothetical protein Q8P56_04830 [Candidatus Uhrbacteria bacterium]|nr:hypothetical protein [Candidatus Uhrbacteria bacterium]
MTLRWVIREIEERHTQGLPGDKICAEMKPSVPEELLYEALQALGFELTDTPTGVKVSSRTVYDGQGLV